MPVRYKPVKKARLFTKNVWYHQIHRNDWSDYIRRLEQQIHWWYVTPIKHLRKLIVRRREKGTGFVL